MPDHGRGDPGDPARRERAQGAAVDARPGPQQRLRRPGAAVRGSVIVSLRNMNRVLEINEECALRRRRAGRALVRPLRARSRRAATSCALDRRPRLGQRHRQHARPRGHLPALRAGHGGAVRHGGRAARTATCCARGMGAMPGNKPWHVYKRGLGPTPDQLFMQSNYGIVTKMGFWLMPSPRRTCRSGCASGRTTTSAPSSTRCASSARPHDRIVPPLDNTICARPPCSPAARSGTTATGRSRTSDRSHRARARARPVDDRWRCVATRPSSTTASRRSRRRSSDPRRRGVGDEARARGRGDARAPGRADPRRRAQPRLEHMTAWYGGEEGGHIGFSPIAPLTGGDALALRDLLRGLIEERGGPRLHRATSPSALGASPRHADHLRHQERGAGAPRLRRAKLLVGGGQAGLRRVPRAPRLHGHRRRPVLLQRPRLPALHRDDQGRTRPERHPLARASRASGLHTCATTAEAGTLDAPGLFVLEDQGRAADVAARRSGPLALLRCCAAAGCRPRRPRACGRVAGS